MALGGAVVDFGVAVIDAKPEKTDISKMESTCGDVMQGFEDALSDLNTRLCNTEDDLNQKPQSNLGQINNHGSDCGIVFEGFDTISNDELKIKKDGDGTDDLTDNNVTNTSLPNIADKLSDVIPDLTTIKDAFPKIIYRPKSIGLGVTGPTANFCSSMDKQINFIKELRSETLLAKRNLELAAENLSTQDGSNKVL